MTSPAASPMLDRLTARQRQCLDLAARHWTSKDIGRQLQIAPKTVDRHIEEAVRRLGVTDRAAAVRLLLSVQPQTASPPHTPAGAAGFPRDGDNPHGESSPMLEAVLAGHDSLRRSELFHGQTPADVHLDRSAGRLGDPRRDLAAEESGVLVAGAAETGLGPVCLRTSSWWRSSTRQSSLGPRPSPRMGSRACTTARMGCGHRGGPSPRGGSPDRLLRPDVRPSSFPRQPTGPSLHEPREPRAPRRRPVRRLKGCRPWIATKPPPAWRKP